MKKTAWDQNNTLRLSEKIFPTANKLTYEEVCKICSTPKKFIRYVQKNKSIYFKAGEFDKVEPVLSYIPRDFFKPISLINEDFLDMVQEYIKEILPLGDEGEVQIYRGLRLPSEENMNWEERGNCWTYEYDAALEFLKYFTKEGKPFLLTADTSSDNVDWILSICLNLTHINEKELRVYDVSKIEDPYLESLEEEELE